MGFGNVMSLSWILTWAAHKRDLFYEVLDEQVKTVYTVDDHLLFSNDTSDNPPSQLK